MSAYQKPLVTVKRARKILGKEEENYTDEEIVALVHAMQAIAKQYINSVPKHD